jgi:hypothetical protein
VSKQLEELHKEGSWNYRGRFIVVTSVHIEVSIQELTFKILQEMWKYYYALDVLTVMSVSNFRFDDIVMDSAIPEGNKSKIDIQLFSWFPYTSPTHCDKIKEAVLVDRWNSDGRFVLNSNLFPEKVPKTFHKCPTKVYSFINPPAVIEISDKNYTGPEINFVELIFKRLNLTADYKVSSNKNQSVLHIFMHTIHQISPASSDIVVGLLPFTPHTPYVAEATSTYLHIKLSWYVPCPNVASRWSFLHKVFRFSVWACFIAVALLAVIIMWLLAKYETKLHVRESANYKTIMQCISNVCAVLTAVSVPQKPTSPSLRIFFIALVCYSFAMTIIYQAYFVELLVNRGFDERITTLNELLQSGIEYGFASDVDVLEFSDPVYLNITRNRKFCKSMYKCLQRVMEREWFATLMDSFHAEFFRSELLLRNIPVSVCTLQEEVMIFSVAVYVAKGNPLLHRFNKIITGIFEAGLYEKWQKHFMSNSRLVDHPFDDINFSNFVTSEFNVDDKPFSLRQLQVLFYTILIAQMFSVLVLAVEVLYYKACVTAAKSTAMYSPQDEKYISTKSL